VDTFGKHSVTQWHTSSYLRVLTGGLSTTLTT